MSDASGSTDSSRQAVVLRAVGAVVLLVLQVAIGWAAVGGGARERALARPTSALALLRLPWDAMGVVESHGDHAFTITDQYGLRTIRITPGTAWLAGDRRVDASALRPGSQVTVWGRRAGNDVSARVVAVWLAPGGP